MVIPVLDARKDPRTDTLEQIASRAGEHPVMRAQTYHRDCGRVVVD
jgi:hypothetical protein